MAMFALRLVTVEPLLSRRPRPALDATRSAFRGGAAATTAPVLRLFGSTPAGQKACVHLHGVFPYLYVPYDDCGGGQQLPDAFLRQFAFSIDRALNVALGNPSSSEQHVFKISLVSGRPFYGFHEKERLFMKIYLYNPRMVKSCQLHTDTRPYFRAALCRCSTFVLFTLLPRGPLLVSELLQGGAVMNKSFQPHDAHVPYVLQFFIDYNLYGMNLLKLAAVKFRRGSPPDKRGEVQASGPEPKPTDTHWVFNSEPMEETQTSLMRWWHTGSIPSSLWLGEEVTRQSRCELELDAVAADILNRLDIEGQIGQNPGLWAIWEDEKQRRRDAGDSSQIGVPASQARLIEDDGQREIVKQIQEMLQRYSSCEGTLPLCTRAEYTPGETSMSLGPPTYMDVTSEDGEVHVSEEINHGDAVVNDDAIRSVVESSQLFSPRGSQSRDSQPLENSGDETMVHLLAGFETDVGTRQESATRVCSGDTERGTGEYRSPAVALLNSRDTVTCFEGGGDGDEDEEELSFVMTQPWDAVAHREVHCDTLKNSSGEQQEIITLPKIAATTHDKDTSETQGTGCDCLARQVPARANSDVGSDAHIASSASLFSRSGQSAASCDYRHGASATFVSGLPETSRKAKHMEAVARDSFPSGSCNVSSFGKNLDKISPLSPLAMLLDSSFNVEQISREEYVVNKQKSARDEADTHDECRKHAKQTITTTRVYLDTESYSSVMPMSPCGVQRSPPVMINDNALNFDRMRLKGDRKMAVEVSMFKPCQSPSFLSDLKISVVKNEDAIFFPDRTSKSFSSPPSENRRHSVNDTTKVVSDDTEYVQHPGFASYYSSCISDHDCEYSDVMSKLSYWSQHSSMKDAASPPQCWSPSDSTIEWRSLPSNLPTLTQPEFQTNNKVVESRSRENLLITSEVNEKQDNLNWSCEIRAIELEKHRGDSLSDTAIHDKPLQGQAQGPACAVVPTSPMNAACASPCHSLTESSARVAALQVPTALKSTVASVADPTQDTCASRTLLLRAPIVASDSQPSLPALDFQQKACNSELSSISMAARIWKSDQVCTDSLRSSWSSTPSQKFMAKPLMSPPKSSKVLATMTKYNLPGTTYQGAYCSDPADVPAKEREVGERTLKVELKHGTDLRESDGRFAAQGLKHWHAVRTAVAQTEGHVASVFNPGELQTRELEHSDIQDYSREDKSIHSKLIVVMSPCKVPPSIQKVRYWLKARHHYEKAKAKLASAALPRNTSASKIATEGRPWQWEGHSTRAVVSHNYLGVGDQPDASTTVFPSAKKDMLEAEIGESAAENAKILVLSPVKRPFADVAHCSSGELLQSEARQPSEHHSHQEPVDPPTESRHVEVAVLPTSIIHSTPVAPRVSDKMNLATVSPIPTACASESAAVRGAEVEDAVAEDLPKRPATLQRMVFKSQIKRRMFSPGEKETSQIEGPTLNNTYGFKISQQNLNNAKSLHEIQHLTLMSMEMHARSRKHLVPDPNLDPVCCIFYHIMCDAPLPGRDANDVTGLIVQDAAHGTAPGSKDAGLPARSEVSGLDVIHVSKEDQLFHELEQIVHRFDPDILLGYEVQMLSWGYLLQRAAALKRDFKSTISRMKEPTETQVGVGKNEEDDDFPDIHIGGRVVLNLWSQMRSEVTLNIYSFENVAYHVLHERYPLFNFRTLSDWFDNKTGPFRWKMVDYYVCRVVGNIKLLNQLDFIGRTSELARLFGIQFHEVLSRGSQFRVESMMLRVAKPLNYIAVSPSVQQRAHMRAAECLPLVMEPESRFYSSPVLVLDFQSLYPSIIIAYNYCYSTCLGRVEHLGTNNEFPFGCLSLKVPPDLLSSLRNKITISPNRVSFVKASVRKGVLPRMLEEILQTRIMVKHCMKDYRGDGALTRLLHARQLGLKLIANVTFGYTAAHFSGRMPCVEVGDSIVHKARETLERAIKQVNETKEWGARVVYGDTDSMFVLLEGASKEQAFRTGKEIAAAVTAANPSPIKLKFEKVYLPCVLQTKKRYVGYMYESLEQKDPVYDAKGIETVRRDGCPAVAKVLERSIKLLFDEKDISRVKQYVQRQCMKILEGRASMQDLIFAKEYRGRSGYKPGACVPALHVARRMFACDRRSEPRAGERVPYVIVHGAPGLPLIQLVRRPQELLQEPSLLINAPYYVSKQILPPLDRLLSLIGVDVFRWYQQLPRSVRVWAAHHQSSAEGRKATIVQYFSTVNCPVCGDITKDGICGQCRQQPQEVAVLLLQQIHSQERRQAQLLQICRSCTGHAEWKPPCCSTDCPTLFRLLVTEKGLCQASYIRSLIDQF
uniref:DNA polymerase zeta catalytic subunit n=1 Tax=Petromyzon marinus TaxID=7757 RepID=A0AAJ7WT71_PETMA|nr:DNA polymerase zeta catalytic subunit isoform X2 [Petromyzon marinus]